MSSIIPTLFSTKTKRRASCDDESIGSHHALNTAYVELKNRYHESEKRNRALSRKIIQQQQGGMNFPADNMALCGGTANGDLNLDASPSQTNLTVSGVSNIQVCQSLESQNFQLQQSNRELSEKVIDLQERCQNIERANEELSVENIRNKEEIQSLSSSVRIRENEHVEKNHKLELENDSYLKKILSFEKKLQFAEKQLQECRARNSKNEVFEPQQTVSDIGKLDDDIEVSLLQTLCTKVIDSRTQIKEFSQLIHNQQTIINQLIKREEDRSNVLSSQKGRVSICTTSRSSSQQSFGARPKTPKSQPSRVWPRCTVTTAAMQCTEDMLKAEMGLSRTSYQQHVGYENENFKLSPSHSSLSANSRKNDLFNQQTEPIPSSPIDSEMADNRTLVNENYGHYKQEDNVVPGGDRLQCWLGQLPARRNDSLEHLHDESPDEDYLADLENINTADDFDYDDNVMKGASSRDDLLLPGAMVGSISRRNLTSTSSSHRLSTTTSTSSAGGNLPVENLDPSLELENRYRPNSSYQLPRPLNIERNEGCEHTAPKSYDNTTQNVNLLMSHEHGDASTTETSAFAPNTFLNNDPLIGHKIIPNKNIYRDDVDKLSNNSSSNVARPAVDSCRVCPICRADFLQHITMEEIQQHVLDCCEPPEEFDPESPAGPPPLIVDDDRICPVCSEQYPDSIPQADYESHVNSHFDEDDPNADQNVDAFGTLNVRE